MWYCSIDFLVYSDFHTLFLFILKVILMPKFKYIFSVTQKKFLYAQHYGFRTYYTFRTKKFWTVSDRRSVWPTLVRIIRYDSNLVHRIFFFKLSSGFLMDNNGPLTLLPPTEKFKIFRKKSNIVLSEEYSR